MDKVEAALDYRLTIGRLFAIAAIIGMPYLVIGLVWSCAHTQQLSALDNKDRAVSFLVAIASWPVLLVTDLCVV